MNSVKLWNFKRISDRTELNRTNPSSPQRTISELFEFFDYFFVSFERSSVRNQSTEQNSSSSSHECIILSSSSSSSVSFEPIFFSKTRKYPKSSSVVRRGELVFNSVRQTLKIREFQCNKLK
jgi:hypothetical protein